MEEMFDLFPRLGERLHQLAGTLSGGERAMLSIARGLMKDAELAVFDEPSLGLSPLLVSEVFDDHSPSEDVGALNPAQRAERAADARRGRLRIRARRRAKSSPKGAVSS